jgi:flagellar biosynthesis protein FlhF
MEAQEPTPMKIKSYFARTVEDAVAQAREELGPEAMLVNSHKAEPEARDLGEYEVVFAADTGSAASAQRPAARTQPSGDRLSTDVAELKKELEGMRRTLTRSAFAPSQWLSSSPDLSEAYAVLTSNEVAPELAREIVQSAAAGASAHGSAFAVAVAEELESRIVVEPLLGRGEARPRIVALVGPPGCGKTTTLVKLAVNYGLATRRPSLLLSMDTYRVAAAEQLRSYAAIIGIGFHVLETAAALSQAIEENRGKDLIFIDTPGFGFGDMDHSAPLAGFLAARSDIDTQLVLSSSMKSADLTRVVDAYESFRPRRLLFTKLDETSSFGSILNETVRTGKPLSFFGNGQRIPEDLETASRSRVSKLVFAGHPARALSAA